MEPGCIDDEQAAALLTGSLDGEARAGIVAHADSCDACHRLLTELARQSTAARTDDAPPLLQPKTRVGRYVIEGVVGAGAMGVVYSALDPQLGRKVALKLLRPKTGDSSKGQQRLLAEAQALAKLSHPNVVHVYDAGEWEARIYVALELVKGGTLSEWLAREPRSVDAIVELFRAAAAGLEAAHAAGIIHRDFKPDNVLVGDDGRVRVSDFGLAASAQQYDLLADLAADPSALLSTKTESGMVVGTPRYMAPEVRNGVRADARSDQWSFCLALDEALGARSPARVKRVTRRGLELDADQRYPSIAALAKDLAWDPKPRRARLAAGLAFAVLAGVALFATAKVKAQDSVCAAGPDRFAAVLPAPRRAKLEEAIAKASTGPLGVDHALVGARLLASLDRYQREWIASYHDACEATHTRGDQSAELLDRKMRCLDAHLAGVDVTASVIERGDPEQLDALASGDVLAPLAACSDRDALSNEVKPPKDPATRAAVDALEVRVARALAVDAAGDYKAARAEAMTLVAEARALGYGPVLARALVVLGDSEANDGAFSDAERDLTEAALSAEASRVDLLAAGERVSLVELVGQREDRAPDARKLVAEARAAIDRIGGNPKIEADLEVSLGDLDDQEDKHDDAKERLTRALEMTKRAYGEESAQAARAENHLTAALDRTPSVSRPDVLAHYRHVLEINERLLGPHHPNVLMARSNIATTEINMGQAKEAVAETKKLVELTEARLGPDHPQTATAYQLESVALSYEPATRDLSVSPMMKAIAILERAPSPSGNLVVTYAQAADLLVNVKQFAVAERFASKAVAQLPAGASPQLSSAVYGMRAAAFVGLGDLARGKIDAEKALALVDKQNGRQVATLELTLSQAVAAANPGRAHQLALDSVKRFEADPIADDERLAAAKAWLAAH